MAAARYWRLVGIETYAGGDLELSELQLHSATGRADGGATLTCSHAPASGALADLADGGTAAVCRFEGAAVRAGGYYLQWDLGAGGDADIAGLRLGGGSTEPLFLASAVLQYLSAGAWVTQFVMGRFTYPGANVLGDVNAVDYARAVLSQAPLLYWRLGETSGTIAADASGNGVPGTYSSNAASLTAGSLVAGDGNPAITLPGTNAQIGVTRATHPLALNTQWTAILIIKPTGTPTVTGVGILYKLGGTYAPEVDVVDNGGGTFRLRVMASGAALLFLSPSSWAYGTTLFVALRCGSGTVRLSVNGEAQGQISHGYPASSGPMSLGFGDFGATDYYPFKGQLDEFSLHATELSDTALALLTRAALSGEATYLAPINRTAVPSAGRVAASAPSSASAVRGVPAASVARDIEHGGPGTIYGTTQIKGTPNAPAKARVVLLHQRSKLPVRETWSDPATGYFEFRGVDTSQQFLTLAEDVAGNFRPVAANKLTPEVLP